MSAKETIEGLLGKADIKINGNRPWDIQVKDERFYGRVLSQGSMGLGESYMDGWFDVEKLDEFFYKLLDADLEKNANINLSTIFSYLRAKIFNLQKIRNFEVGEKHYDIGNDLYEAMLDKNNLAYTCGYWRNAENLEQAQDAKLDLICRKIGLKPGDKVLDIGSGWGSFINFAAKNYGAECVGVTVSKEQVILANERRGDLPVETRLQDYNDINEKFNHIVSVGMFEHVGCKNYRKYMEKAHSMLEDDGLFLLHTIGRNTPSNQTDPWIDKYIFPNGMLPSTSQIAKAYEGLFVMEDWHNFGENYDKTLMAWFHNFDSNWDMLKSKYGDRFYRMWKYYLLSCAGGFRSRKNQLWQIVLSKKGVKGGYVSIR